MADRMQPWRGGRVVDGSGLENRRAERHRGFESHPLRLAGLLLLLGTIWPLLHLPASATPLCPDSFSTPEGSSQPGYDPLSERHHERERP